MAKNILELPYTAQRLTDFLNSPFQIYEDRVDKCKRLFLTEEDAARWFEARDNKQMTPEIAALEFAHGTIPGTEQYKLTFTILNVDDASTYGTTAKLRFSFSTVDTLNNNIPTEEPVEAFFSFSSDAGVKTDSKIFQYVEGVTEFDITEYLEPDVNEITVIVRGRTSGLAVTAKATYTSVYLPFDSNFDIAADRRQGVNFGIPYSVSGIGQKEIEFVIDSGAPFNDTVYDGTANKTYSYINRLAPGLHTLQMKAKTTINNKAFESDMLYFEFVVAGSGLDLTTVVIKSRFPSGTPYFMDRMPGLMGEQYNDYYLTWAYVSTSRPNAVVVWKTMLNGVETVVGSREIDEMEGTVGIMPDPVMFQPDSVGVYDLYAFIKGEEETPIGQYTINVIENTAGLREAEGYTMKLDAKGRSNDEPAETLHDWSNGGFVTTFNEKMTFDGLAGYTGRAVRLDNGATALNSCKPFAVENAILTNGCAISFQFRTRNIEDENVPLIEIGNPEAISTAYFAIYGKKVILRPSNGRTLEYQFASEEDTHLALVIHPKTGVTDAQMMFFIFNGVEAPGSAYGDTAVFNIGSYADTSDTNGMIRMGDASGKAAIDIYSIRVYGNMLSMWQGMNNYMIDKGGNVGQMMRKNNVFVNNDFNRPNINLIKEQYRVLEIIGPLGKLETSSKKENFFCSARYTDPFAPKFNFERMDGGAYVETAGQSRLEDLMAKSFHLDMNENDTPALYQDGKPCHKNRFIFAENNIPENGVRIDVSGADSSMTRNASHMKMVNRFYPYIQLDGKYVLRTPPQEYALSGKWSEDMARSFGGSKEDYPWKNNINFAPDSVPIVVVWHEKEDDPIQVYGLAQMTEEKKASYANGNHSIYLKPALSDGTLDPFDRYPGTKGNRGWDNEGVVEVEYVNPSDLTNNISTSGFFNQDTRDYSFELCFPKKKDLEDGGTAVWTLFHDEFLAPITATRGNETAFRALAEDVLYLPSFAMYYNVVMNKKMNDSLCRNLHVIRYNMGTKSSPKWQWWAKWWDADVSTGLFQSNAMGVDPATDRQTKDANGNYVMAGHEMWIWNALENWPVFKDLCKAIAEEAFKAGWSVDTEIEEQDRISNSYSEGLYNLDGLLKFLYAYRKGNDYMIRMQGSSTPYRHGFLKDSYNVREAQMAIGQYAARSVSFRATGATHPSKVTLSAAAHTWFGLGTTSTNIVTGIEHDPSDGEFSIQIPEGMELGRDFLSVYGADKIRSLDISDFVPYLSVQINLGNLTQVQKLMVGYPGAERLAQLGFNSDPSISFTGVDSMSRLMELSIMGLHALEDFPLATLNHLTRFLAAGSGLKAFRPENGTKFNEVTLPDTIQTIEARNVQLGDLSFWKSNLEAGTVSRMESCPVDLLNLTLVGMGDDEGAHNLVHMWLQMLRENPHLIQTAQITYRAITWMGISKEDILTLARIPKGQCNVTGYVFCEEPYTKDEMSTLLNAFGPNVFDYSTTATNLVCDCEGTGITVSAAGEGVMLDEAGNASIIQGANILFSGAGFPISGSTKDNYRWRAWVEKEHAWFAGNEDMPVIKFGDNNEYSLNWLTGEFTSEESPTDSLVMTIGCYDKNTFVAGTIEVTINPRTYPNTAEIVLASSQNPASLVEGVLQITSRGAYNFRADNLRIIDGEVEEYNGTMMQNNGGEWELVGADEEYVTRDPDNEQNPFINYCLQVSKLPEGETEMILKYRSNWKANDTLTGRQMLEDELHIAIVSVIAQLLINDESAGNVALFAAVKEYGITPTTTMAFSSLDVVTLAGEFNVTDLLENTDVNPIRLRSFQSGKYNVLHYLKNISGLDFHKSGVEGDVDVSKNRWLTSVNAGGTYANIIPATGSQLQSVKLGAPKKFVIDSGNSVYPDIQWAGDIEEVSITEPEQKDAFARLLDLHNQQEAEKDYTMQEIDMDVTEQYNGIGAGQIQMPDINPDVWLTEGNIKVNAQGLVTIPNGEFDIVKVKGVGQSIIFYNKFGVNIEKVAGGIITEHPEIIPVLVEHPEIIPVLVEHPEIIPVLVEHPDYAPWIAEWPMLINNLIDTGKKNVLNITSQLGLITNIPAHLNDTTQSLVSMSNVISDTNRVWEVTSLVGAEFFPYGGQWLYDTSPWSTRLTCGSIRENNFYEVETGNSNGLKYIKNLKNGSLFGSTGESGSHYGQEKYIVCPCTGTNRLAYMKFLSIDGSIKGHLVPMIHNGTPGLLNLVTLEFYSNADSRNWSIDVLDNSEL